MRSGWLAAATLLLALASTHAGAAAKAPARVVALGGDVTATVYLLDAGDRLAGVDTTSEWPAAARKLPDVGYLRQLHAEGILSLDPGMVIANPDAGPPLVLRQLRHAGVHVHVLERARDPAGVLANVRRVGRWLGRAAQAEKLAARLRARYAALATSVAAMKHRPRVLFLLATGNGSPMVAGRHTAADRAIALAGGHNVGEGFDGYKAVSAEALVAMAPQVIVLMREFKQAAGGITGVLAQPGMAQTPAGRARRVIFVDGEALLGFGPRNAKAEQQLQRILARVP